MRNWMKRAMVAGLLAAAVNSAAWASGGPREGRRPGVPPEAVEACKGKSAGEAVTMKTPWGETIKATCREIAGQLAAVPDNPPPPPGNGEPPKGNGESQ